MINELHLERFLLMPEAHIEFSQGLNVITGETGAGKSVLLEAVKLVLGKKAKSGLVLPGENSARLQARFDISELEMLKSKLADLSLTDEDDPSNLIISRTFKNEGSDKIFVNGFMTTNAVLREIGAFLMEIHGQNEHQTLLMPETQRRILDHMGGEEHKKRLEYLSSAFAEKKRLATLLEEFEKRLASVEERLEYLRDIQKELEALQLSDKQEEERLTEECNKLAHAESFAENIARAIFSLEGDENAAGVVQLLHSAKEALLQAAAIDKRLGTLSARLESLYYEAVDISTAIHRESDFEFDRDRLSFVQSRLAAIQRACRRYNTNFCGLFDLMERIEHELADLTAPHSDREKLVNSLNAAERTLRNAADEVSLARRKIASELELQVSEIMAKLGFNAARFTIDMKEVELSAAGREKIEFLVSLNPGMPEGPLRRIASGGELSRVALALKQAAAEGDDLPTLLFDEIDAGIGGTTAEAVASSLKLLAEKKQLILVTHLHQIAKEAERHFTVTKRVSNDTTFVQIAEVKGVARELEIARMLGGRGEEGLAFAKALLLQKTVSNTVE